jgi:hypothetical protein
MKSKGECILQDLVRSNIEGLERNRRKGTSLNQVGGGGGGRTQEGDTLVNGTGTMIEHSGKVEQYEPFWEARGDEEEGQQEGQEEEGYEQGTMVIKESTKT